MNNKETLVIIIMLLCYLALYETHNMAYGIGIRPNAGEVYAEVKEKVVTDKIAKVTLHILEVKDYESMPNFVKDQAGKDISITVSKDDLPFFNKDKVNVLISAIGDEKQELYTARIKS